LGAPFPTARGLPICQILALFEGHIKVAGREGFERLLPLEAKSLN